jgi:protein gp37
MGERSVIEWTHSTWNPWRGCDKVSPGCAECYMFRDQRRYGRDPETVVRAAPSTFLAPARSRRWLDERDRALAETGHHLVFTCSWSDWFHPAADGWRDEAWEVIRDTPQSTYQILTKRPENILDGLPADWGDGWPNVWLGVTIENRRYVHRADVLRQVPAAVRFVSAEPLLGPLVFDARSTFDRRVREWSDGHPTHRQLDLANIDWLISGGESGGREGRALVQRVEGVWRPKPEALTWVRDLRDCCEASGVAFLHKQWGGPRPTSGGRELDGRTWDDLPREPARSTP